MTTDVIILAAGKGTRMKSSIPKVLHQVGGKPMLEHIVDTVSQIDGCRTHVVVGHGGDVVKQQLSHLDVNWAVQTEQLGTGHAVAQAIPAIQNSGKTLVLVGDIPLISQESIEAVLAGLNEAAVSVLSVHAPDPTGYGRIIRETDGRCVAITEHKDATEIEREITEVNTGVIAIRGDKLEQYISAIENNNSQQEYYLTDVIQIANEDGQRVEAVLADSWEEVSGVNSRLQQAMCERQLQEHEAMKLLDAGVHIIDPGRLDVRGSLVCGRDVSIDVNCVFIGDVQLGDNVTVGANSVLTNCSVAANTQINPFSSIEGATIGESCSVGPFARLRPGSQLGDHAKVGNFVETKKAVIGQGSKVSHLSYIGDAEIGVDVNIGAGTITCNYDGVNKHQTVIGDGAFVGSGTQLVAPVTVGKMATIGAGSTIRKAAPDGQLTLTVTKQRSVSWTRPTKK